MFRKPFDPPEERMTTNSIAKTNPPRQLSLMRNKRLWGLLLISPWLVGLVLYKLAPILVALVISFTNFFFLEPDKIAFVGLTNYVNLLKDPNLGSALAGTFKLALVVIPLQTGAAILLASLLSNRTLRMRDTLRVLFFLPSILPSVAAMFMWAGFIDPHTGWLYPLLLNPLGLSKIVQIDYPMLLILATFWSIGPGFLIMIGAMQGIPEDIYEAVLVDGAGRVRRFFAITLPMISPAIFFTLILNLTAVFGGAVLLDRGTTFDPGYSSMDNYLHFVMFGTFKMGAAASLAWIFFLITLAVIMILVATSKYWVYFPDEGMDATPKQSAAADRSTLQKDRRPSQIGSKEPPSKRISSIQSASRTKSREWSLRRPAPAQAYPAEVISAPIRTESLDALSERPAFHEAVSSPRKIRRPSRIKNFLVAGSLNLFAWALLAAYLLPVAFAVTTAFKPTEQLDDPGAPWYPSRKVTAIYQDQAYPLVRVFTLTGVRELVLFRQGPTSSLFLDPQNPTAGPIKGIGPSQSLKAVYEPYPVWSNFTILLTSLPFPELMRNTLLLVLIGEIGVLVSSILISYGLSRFPLPGGNLLFFVLLATILIPDKVTFVPIYFFYIKVLHWQGTLYPLVAYLFFGSPVFIFLLRQNFKTIPIETEEAAMLDGAGPLRRLWSIVLPLCWPAVITISLLQFFITWNETRLASLYLGVNSHLMPLSFGIQNYQSYTPIQNVIQAGSIVVLAFPFLVLILSQRFFMRSMVITGMEKR
jgi:multiple sugar transport system permease protein